MEQKLVTQASQDLALFDQLFTEAFPPAERILPSTLVQVDSIQLNGFYENGKRVGMLVTIPFPDFVYIIFLATFAEYRGQGIGSKIINTFFTNHPDVLTIGSIEKPDETAENNTQRLSRQKFYQRLGFVTHDFGIHFHGCDFLTVAKGKNSNKREVVECGMRQAHTLTSEMAAAFGQ